jgi:two-component system OmpR family sensor kinase/two-component system sensor histidine kinase BaeS
MHDREWRPPHRPRWWPENENWPPPQRSWRVMRARFLRRMAIGVSLFFAFAILMCAVFLSIAASLAGSLNLAPGVALLLLLVMLGGAMLMARGFRRFAAPVGDMLEASERVAQGDYSAQVAERGPREIRSLARAFNAMTQRLQLSDEQRRNLLADVTHELRTPLTVIQGNLEGLLDGVYPRDDEHLELILEETRVLSRLIDDLRTLALAESGALKLQIEPTDPAALLHETAAAFRAQADAEAVRLEVDAPSDAQLIHVDPARMRAVLSNLITNALRYTPRGGLIRLGCAVTDERVVLSIEDTGKGIAPDDLPHVFDRFYRTSDSRGSGLGLAIAKNLVEAHGGEIRAESDLGQGTRVYVTLSKLSQP